MYEECVKCEKIGVSCDGPNFMAMTSHELMTWCKERKAHLRWSNARLAEEANMPKGTIDGLLAGKHPDYKFESIRPLVKALVGGKWDGNPCPDPEDDSEEIIKALEKENADLKKDKRFLKTMLMIAGFLVVISAVTICTALIIDRTDPTRGFFWLEETIAAFHNKEIATNGFNEMVQWRL